MTLYLWIRDYLKKLSYIKAVDFKGTTCYIYYLNEGKTKHKKLPYRATKDQLLNCLEKIKKEIGYQEFHKKEWEEKKKSLTDDAGFAFIEKKGETGE